MISKQNPENFARFKTMPLIQCFQYFQECDSLLALGLAMDATGNIYVLDASFPRVMKWAPGATQGVIVAGNNGQGSNLNQFNLPEGMYIADTNNCRVIRWASGASNGTIVAGSNACGNSSSQLKYPWGVFVDSSSTMYIADTMNNRIQRWISGASAATTVAGQSGVYGSGLNQLANPSRVVVDASGSIYIADSGNARIMRWTLGATFGVLIGPDGGQGTQSNQLWLPIALQFDPVGALVVADYDNNRVQKYDCRELETTLF
jgi:sugar lactone lactonase YvrE